MSPCGQTIRAQHAHANRGVNSQSRALNVSSRSLPAALSLSLLALWRPLSTIGAEQEATPHATGLVPSRANPQRSAQRQSNRNRQRSSSSVSPEPQQNWRNRGTLIAHYCRPRRSVSQLSSFSSVCADRPVAPSFGRSHSFRSHSSDCIASSRRARFRACVCVFACLCAINFELRTASRRAKRHCNGIPK